MILILIDFKVVGEFIRSCLPRQNPGWMLTYLLTLLTYLLTLLTYFTYLYESMIA